MAAAAQPPTSQTEPFPQLEVTPETSQSVAADTVPTSNNPLIGGHSLQLPSSQGTRGKLLDNSPKTGKARLSASASPLPLTGAAAMAELKRRKQQKEAEDSRQTSPNPAVEAMHTLMGNGGMTKASEAPAPAKLSEPMRQAAEKIQVNDAATTDTLLPSPTSLGSFGTSDNAAAAPGMTATANNASASDQAFVAEPAAMSEGYPGSNSNADASPDGDSGRHAYTYPGPPPQDQQEDGPARGMSLPGYGQSSPKSPASNKRHKCPYCATDFTRHHNLKSHLLTHSQEKPYVCQTCNARFRRLHDLKRHSKLHTGERPHTCDKCGRKFARGDALARHNKGPGGCAGRRSSFGGDDDFDGDGGPDGMDGVQYTGDEDEETLDAHGRRVSEPSRKRAHLETVQDSNRQVYRQHSSTYPPVQGRPGPGSMPPPQVIHPGQGSASSPRDGSGHPSPTTYYPSSGQGQMYPMTESPKPLSPGQPGSEQHRLGIPDGQSNSLNRNRSPSLTTQFQQAHFGRGSGRATPPYASGHGQNQGIPQLPVLPGMNSTAPQQPRPAMQPSTGPSGPGPSLLQHGSIPPPSGGHGGGSGPGSLSSHGQSSGNSIRDALGHEQTDIWSYVRSLEQRFHRMQDEYELRISRLQEEVISLRGQMSNAASYSSEMAGGQPRY